MHSEQHDGIHVKMAMNMQVRVRMHQYMLAQMCDMQIMYECMRVCLYVYLCIPMCA